MGIDYLEGSAKITSSLDHQALNTRELGPMVVERSHFRQFSLGSIAVQDRALYLGVAIPRGSRFNASMLFANSMVFTTELLERCPDLEPNTRTFQSALIPRENVSFWLSGVLVEDVTRGGRLPAQTLSTDLQARLEAEGLIDPRRTGDFQTVIDPESGVERMIDDPDFTMLTTKADKIRQRLKDHHARLRIDLIPGSPLTRTLEEQITAGST